MGLGLGLDWGWSPPPSMPCKFIVLGSCPGEAISMVEGSLVRLDPKNS